MLLANLRNSSALGRVIAAVAGIHVLAGVMLLVSLSDGGNYAVGSQVFGVGLAVTAYIVGLRHAFDADHIAAIDNTTRRLMGDGKQPIATGFWFALGHSTIVFALTALVTLGVHATDALLSDDSPVRTALSAVGTGLAGTFLLVLAVANLVSLGGILRIWRRMRRGRFDTGELDNVLDRRGIINRLLRGITNSITRPRQMFAVGLVFGLGFDTASEVALLVLAGNGAAGNLPWYAIAAVPLLFTAGMTLLDTVDGAFMALAYRWAFTNPTRKLSYNAAVTALSAVIALGIGGIQVAGMLHDDIGLTDPITTAIAETPIEYAEIAIVVLFLIVWLAAVTFTRFTSPTPSSLRAPVDNDLVT